MKKNIKKRYSENGISALSDREKLLLLLTYSERASSAEAITDCIMKNYGSVRSVADSDPMFLMNCCGATQRSAALLFLIPQLSRKCAIVNCGSESLSSAEAAKKYFSAYLRSCQNEMIAAAVTDEKFRIISSRFIGAGERSSVKISCRALAEFVLHNEGKYVFVGHNHVSSNPEPSEEDILSTAAMSRALCNIDITLVDHIITCSGNSAVSIREEKNSVFVNRAENYMF